MSRPSSTQPGLFSPLLLLGHALGLVLVASCGGGAPAEGPGPGLDVVALTLEGERGQPPAERVVQSLSVEDGGWTVPSGEGALGDDGLLRVQGSLNARISFRGSFSAASFQRLVVRGSVSAPELLAVRLWASGEVVLRGAPAPFLPGQEQLAFDLPAPDRRSLVYDRIEVVGVREQVDFSIRQLDMVDVPTERLLPLEVEETWVSLAEDARRGHVLWPGEVWHGNFELDGPARLLVGFGLPEGVRGEAARLEVVLAKGKQLRREEITLDLRTATPGWVSANMVLAPEVGDPWIEGEVSLRVQFEGDPGSVLAFETPIVVRPRPDSQVVLLLTSDTHRADYLSAGRADAPVRTPILDSLARKGVLFRDVLATSNYTLPSHAALFTGAHPRATDIIANGDSLALEATTLAERFREAGFMCLASVSAAHLDPVRSGLGQGFQRFGTPTDIQRDSRLAFHQMEKWLNGLRDRPLFLWIHAFDAHAPYKPPEEFLEHYYSPERDERDPSLPEPPLVQQRSWLHGVRDPEYPFAAYSGEVHYLDSKLGRFLEHPALEKALIAVTADHGESLGEQDSWFTHEPLSHATLAVPMLLSGPGVPRAFRNARIEGPVRHLDLSRTLLDLAGLGSADFPGRNLLEPSEVEPRISIAAQGRSATLELGGWMLLMHLVEHRDGRGGTHERHEVRLFDLSTDARCEVDLAREQPQRARSMREHLVRFLSETPRLDWCVDAPAEDIQNAHIRALGYVEAQRPHVGGDWIDPACACSWCEAVGTW